MKKYVIILIAAFSIYSAASQELEHLSYTVQLGETVRMISKKFKIAPSEIYRDNRFAVEGIKEGMVLDIFVPKKYVPQAEEKVIAAETVEDKKTIVENSDIENDAGVNVENETQPISHRVIAKETLYSISKKYNVSIDEIKQQNEDVLKRGVQPGQVLIIRENNKMATAD